MSCAMSGLDLSIPVLLLGTPLEAHLGRVTVMTYEL